MPNQKLRVAVLGAGRWANMAHIPGWLRDPRVQLIALCDVEPQLAKDMAANFNIHESTDDWQSLISRPDIDVIDIVTPSDTHHELASAAIHAGKHVLCEKPVAQDFRETLRLSALADSKGPQNQARLHLPIHPRRPVRQVPHRRRIRRKALHLQRIRAELPVDQPPNPPPPLPDARRPVPNPGRLPSKATALQSSTSADGGSAPTTPASSAPCETSSPKEWSTAAISSPP